MANKFEQRQNERRLKLQVLWKEQEIGGQFASYRRPFDLEKADRKKMEAYEKMPKHGEKAWWAEAMMLEGSDSEGMIGSAEGYNWFEDRVVAYKSSECDDRARGQDAILMFRRPIQEGGSEEKSKGYPLAVDVTTNITELLTQKIPTDTRRLNFNKPNPSYSYWTDVTVEEPGEQFDSPEEGKVEVLGVSVFMPESLPDRFRDSSTTAEQADQIICLLGPYVLRQIKAELEGQAMILIKKINPDTLLSQTTASDITREELTGLLSDEEYVPPISHPGLRTCWYLITKILPMVNESLEAAKAKKEGLLKKHPMLRYESDELDKKIPTLVTYVEEKLFKRAEA